MSERTSVKEIRELLNTQGKICALTGDKLTPSNVAADHIIPVSRGGPHTVDNIQLVTIDANRLKSTLTMDELLALCTKVVKYVTKKKCNGTSPTPRKKKKVIS